MQWQSYKEKVRELSDRLVQAQRPIRILNAIKVDPRLEAQFKASGYRDIPKVTALTYSQASLGFDLVKKGSEFKEIIKDIDRLMGVEDELGRLLKANADQYLLVLEMLKVRGTKKFYEFSRRLYGSPQETLLSDKNTVFEMATLLYSILTGIKNTLEIPNSEKNLSAQDVVHLLNQRFRTYFQDVLVEAELSDGVVADAAAGGDKVRIRSDRTFSLRDVEVFEVHEGWVHVGTTMNGRNQPVAKWLAVGPPRCTSTQEGLAVLMEIFTFRSSAKRAQRINDRIISIAKAEDGASLSDIFEYFRTEGYAEEDCLTNAFRIFRGSHYEGGSPFTKDISYCKGFVENYNFLRTAIRANKPFLIPFLFAGKLNVEDIPLIYQLYKEGVVEAPRYLPRQFSDINGIAVWMSFSSFFNKVDLRQVQAHFNKLFKKFL
jgi:uncharacterized protein (TIGR02421 family)